MPRADGELLDEYRLLLRDELRATMHEIRPASVEGLFGVDQKRPPLPDRIALVGLADRIARAIVSLAQLELAGDVEPEPEGRAVRSRRLIGRP